MRYFGKDLQIIFTGDPSSSHFVISLLSMISLLETHVEMGLLSYV